MKEAILQNPVLTNNHFLVDDAVIGGRNVPLPDPYLSFQVALDSAKS